MGGRGAGRRRIGAFPFARTGRFSFPLPLSLLFGFLARRLSYERLAFGLRCFCRFRSQDSGFGFRCFLFFVFFLCSDVLSQQRQQQEVVLSTGISRLDHRDRLLDRFGKAKTKCHRLGQPIGDYAGICTFDFAGGERPQLTNHFAFSKRLFGQDKVSAWWLWAHSWLDVEFGQATLNQAWDASRSSVSIRGPNEVSRW